MGRIDHLLANYRRQLSLPLRVGLPLSQRVWFAVYPPEEERRLTNRFDDFEIATKEAQLWWKRVDLTTAFADWVDTFDKEERELCLANPEIIESYSDPGFRDFICARIAEAIAAAPLTPPDRTVFAITGLMDLYDFVHVSA